MSSRSTTTSPSATREWMGRIHRFLGLEVGVILANMTARRAPQQYACDITYGTNNEFGFDYLRDNMAWIAGRVVQRGHNFAVVDEVDSILIDEARTPLIISGPADQATKWYADFAKIVPRLRKAASSRASRRRRLRGRREEAHRRHPRDRCREGRGLARHRQPLRAVNTPLVATSTTPSRPRNSTRRTRTTSSSTAKS